MLALLVLLTALAQTATKVDAPPVPDFKTKIDYRAWLEKQITAGLKEEDNAAPLYRKMIGAFTATDNPSAALGFSGPRSDKDSGFATGPWNPADHAGWERSCQRTKDLMDDFVTAAAKPYAYYGLRYGEESKEATRTLLDIVLDHLGYVRALAKGASDHAWRAEKGTLDGDRFVTLMTANLGLARQVGREPFTISQLVGYAIRNLANDDLISALHHDVLSPAQRKKCLSLLRSRDAEVPPFRSAAHFELAALYSAVQLLASQSVVLPGAGRVERLPNPAQTCRKAREYFDALAARAEGRWAPDFESEMNALQEKLSADDQALKTILPGLERAVALRFRLEAGTRATRLLYELFDYHDKNKAWPDSLDKLPGVPAAAKTDPFSGKPFIYRRDGDGFTLYSVGTNTRDDGGNHDPKFGEKTGDGDYVFWPVQKDR